MHLVDPSAGQIGESDKVLGAAQPLGLEPAHLTAEAPDPVIVRLPKGASDRQHIGFGRNGTFFWRYGNEMVAHFDELFPNYHSKSEVDASTTPPVLVPLPASAVPRTGNRKYDCSV